MPDYPAPPPSAPPDAPLVPPPLAEVVLHKKWSTSLMAYKSAGWGPVFSADEAKKLDDHSRAQDLQDQAQRLWRPLETWLSDRDRDQADALCRKSGLTVLLHAGVDAQKVQLLPVEELHAEFRYLPTGLPEQVLAFPEEGIHLDESQGSLSLRLAFADDPAGHQQYQDVMAAMSRPGAQARVELTCRHRYTIMEESSGTAEPGPTGPIILPGRIPINVLIHPMIHPVAPAPAPEPVPAVDPRLHLLALRRVLPEDLGDPPPPSAPPAAKSRLPIYVLPDARIIDILRGRLPAGGNVPALPRSMTLDQRFTVSLARRPDQFPEVYPDLPRPGRDAWGQFTGPSGQVLHYRGSERLDTYFYLPASYRLGFYADAAGAALRPPLTITPYLDAAGSYRVKSTLLALPFVDDQDREQLRSHVLNAELKGTMPFVRLVPASGLSASFAADFVPGGTGTGAGPLPAGIRLTLNAGLEKVLVFEFDMGALDESYAIFCEALRRGLLGRVMLKEGSDGLQAGVDVVLRLDDVLANALDLRLAQESPVSPPVLTAENLVPYPVRLSSLRGFLVARGSDAVPGLIFEAQGQDLAAGGRAFDASGGPGARAALPLPEWHGREPWDDLVVSPGKVQVQGGTPEEWLDRVHRDPSLLAHTFGLKVEVLVPPAGKDLIDLIQLRLFSAGADTPREQRALRPADPPWDLQVQMTLAELAGASGKLPQLFIEHYSVYKDGSPGLPQRTPVTLNTKDLLLQALVETAGGRYILEHGGAREDGADHKGLARTEAEQRLAALRTGGETWSLYLAPAQPSQPAQPFQPVQPTQPVQPAGPPVTVLTDLLEGPFGAGKLKQVFVTLRPPGDAAPGSTYRFDKDSHAQAQWRPASGTIPPFQYRIIYLYPSGATREVQGTETNLVLLLDPPAE